MSESREVAEERIASHTTISQERQAVKLYAGVLRHANVVHSLTARVPGQGLHIARVFPHTTLWIEKNRMCLKKISDPVDGQISR
jgi:hypothetical protein